MPKPRRDLFAGAKPYRAYSADVMKTNPRLPKPPTTLVKGDDANAGKREVVIQKEILDWLRASGIWAWRNNSTGRLGIRKGGIAVMLPGLTPGAPDVFGILPGGRMLAIEVKRPGGRLSSVQASWLDRARTLGACAFVATSVREVEERLRAGRIVS